MDKELQSRMKSWGAERKPITLDTPFSELNVYSEDFPEAKTLAEVIAMRMQDGREKETWRDENAIPLDSQLGRHVAQYVDRYFPGGRVTSIQSRYHEGVFIGDYSIHLDVNIEHPTIERVGVNFTNEDVPYKPQSWQEMLTLGGIDLYMTNITVRGVGYNEKPEERSRTYTAPGMFHEEMKQWYDKQGDGMLYSLIETSEMLIIATEQMSHSHEEVKQAAQQLVQQAKTKIEQERRELEELIESRDKE